MLANWQLACYSGPWWSVLLKLPWRCEFRSSTGVRWFKQYTLSNKVRTDRRIWSLLMSLRNQETLVLRDMISLRHAPSQQYEKISFTFVTVYFKRDTSVLKLFPTIVLKKRIGCNIITHKVNFDIQREIAKNGPRRRYIDITLSIVDMDFLHR